VIFQLDVVHNLPTKLPQRSIDDVSIVEQGLLAHLWRMLWMGHMEGLLVGVKNYNGNEE
jgi:hypothetical protein